MRTLICVLQITICGTTYSTTSRYNDSVRRHGTMTRYNDSIRRCSTTCGATVRYDDAVQGDNAVRRCSPIYGATNYVAHIEGNCTLSDTICVLHTQIPREPRTEPNEPRFKKMLLGLVSVCWLLILVRSPGCSGLIWAEK